MSNYFAQPSDSNNFLSAENSSFLFVLDLTSSLRFEAKREIIKQSVILPILRQYTHNTNNNNNNLCVTFASLIGSISLGLFCTVLKSFKNDSKTFFDFLNEIDRFLSKEIDKIVDFGLTGDSLIGSFGIGGTVEAICTALCHFNELTSSPENFKKHLILLPTSSGTEILPLFRTCTDDTYASASIPHLLSILRARKISLSLVAPGLSDSTVVEQFIVFKCNEKIGNSSKLTESLGSDWVVRLSANLTGEDPALGVTNVSPVNASVTAPAPINKHIDENELLNQTLMKLSTMPPDERVIALKTLLDPATSTFSSSFRQKFAAAVKSRLQSQEKSANAPASQNQQPTLPNQLQQQQQQQHQAHIPRSSVAFNQRRASQDSSTNFWSGCIRFTEKQQTYIFRVQFVAENSQMSLPRASLDNWPSELNLTGLLDSKKESIQSGLSVGYAFRVNVASADTAVASYLMSKMSQGPPPSTTSTNSSTVKHSTPSHLACFRISQDVLIMLRVLSNDGLQFVGYLIDRRFPKNNLTPAAQAASNAINSLTSLKPPMSTTLSTGMDGLSLGNSGRRPSFDVKISSFSNKQPVPAIQQNKPMPMPTQQPQAQSQQKSTSITTNYMTYPQFMQQQQRSPAKIPAISAAPVPSNHLLTDPQAILQKLRPVVQKNSMMEPIPPPMPQTNQQEQVAADDQELVQSFVDAWLN